METRNNKITAAENKNNDMYDGFVLPFDKTDIILMVKFDSAYHIEYIRGKIITYSPSKSGKGIDVSHDRACNLGKAFCVLAGRLGRR